MVSFPDAFRPVGYTPRAKSQAVASVKFSATPPSPEQVLEALLPEFNQAIANRLKEDWQYQHPGKPIPKDLDQRKPGARRGLCGFASLFIEQSIRERGLGDAQRMSVRELLGAGTGDRQASDENAFSHAFCAVKIQGKPFLVDLTVEQFVEKDGRLVGYFGNPGQKRYNGRRVNEFPVLRTLMEKGYAPLTPETVAEYVSALSLNQKPGLRQQLAENLPVRGKHYYYTIF